MNPRLLARSAAIVAMLLTGYRAQAVAQSSARDEASVAFIYGIAFGSSSGVYSDLFGLTTLPARTVVLAGISPKGRFLVDGTTRIGAVDSPFGGVLRFRASGVDQNRFHGVGNRTPSDRPPCSRTRRRTGPRRGAGRPESPRATVGVIPPWP